MMDDSPLPEYKPRTHLTDRLLALFEVLLLSGLVSSSLALLPFSAVQRKRAQILTSDAQTLSAFLLLEAAITIAMMLAILKAHRETFGSLGLRGNHWKTNASLGLALVPFLFLINALVLLVFRTYLPGYYLERNPLTEIIHTPQQLALFIFSALIAGGVKEELQRAFVLNRFGRYLGGAGLGLVLWSFAFGAGHYLQGVQGIAIATIFGFIFGGTYLLSGSLIAPMIAHGTYDTLALLAYWFFSRA
jgi:membrane protease YdiL (CAAX protease family)